MDEDRQDRRRHRIVTPEQYSAGYLDLFGPVAFHRRWSLVRRLDDGNYVVVDPADDIPLRPVIDPRCVKTP